MKTTILDGVGRDPTAIDLTLWLLQITIGLPYVFHGVDLWQAPHLAVITNILLGARGDAESFDGIAA